MIVAILYGNYYRTGFEQESSQKEVIIAINYSPTSQWAYLAADRMVFIKFVYTC